MSWWKKALHIIDPGSRLIVKDNKKAGPAAATPEDYQGELNAETSKYSQIAPDAQQGAIDRAKLAGTYSNSTAFKEQAAAESDAATRQNQSAAQARANALRVKLNQPIVPPGQIGA
jgi:hypothetical protein